MTGNSLRLGFAGTPEIAATILDTLISQHYVPECIITQPDRPAGRGRKTHASAVKRIAENSNIRLLQPANSEELAKQQLLSQLDLLIVVAYGIILPAEVLRKPRKGCINVHMSLLPRWRGAAPIQRAIEAGDKETGVSIMLMDEGLDTGPLIQQKSCEISRYETSATLHDKLAVLGSECLLTSLEKLGSSEITTILQNEQQATYASKINKTEAFIDWSSPADLIERKIRAFNPVPVARAKFGTENIKIWEADIIKTHSNHPPGTVIKISGKGVDVATTNGAIRLLKIQLPGKKIMHIAKFLNGHADFFNPYRISDQ